MTRSALDNVCQPMTDAVAAFADRWLLWPIAVRGVVADWSSVGDRKLSWVLTLSKSRLPPLWLSAV